MADEDKRDDSSGALGDEATLLKKRARRRLIGAAALALFAAVVLPLVMDHQPAPPLKDIQVRIPSPDEGVTQRVSPPPATKSEPKTEPKPEVKPAPKPEPKPEQKPETRPETKPVPKPEPKIEPPKAAEKPVEAAATNGKVAAGGEAWEVQLGAYQEPGRVKLLVDKLKGLGLPSYTEKVDTPNGPRTRVRAGPFPSQEAAEKAKERIKIIGVDGPVAKKP
jgi:DedD protein